MRVSAPATRFSEKSGKGLDENHLQVTTFEHGARNYHILGYLINQIVMLRLVNSRAQENLVHADWAFSGFQEVDLGAIANEFNG